MRTNNEIREKIVKMYLEGYSINNIVSAVSCAKRTIYKVLDAAGVKGAERQEREADVINITLTDSAVVQWLRSQPNAAEAIAKLVYSQIEGSQKQNCRIAEPEVGQKTKKYVLSFFGEGKTLLGKETVEVPYPDTNNMLIDIAHAVKDMKYENAKAVGVLSDIIHFEN